MDTIFTQSRTNPVKTVDGQACDWCGEEASQSSMKHSGGQAALVTPLLETVGR